MIPAIASGMYMGEIIGFSLSGVLTNWSLYINDQYWGGWQSVFYVFGLTGILWFPYWALFAYESPDKHPKVTKEELDLISEGKGYTAIVREGREEEEYGEGKKLISSVMASPEFEHPYNSPLIESVNPISRFADRSVTNSVGEDPVYRFDIDNDSNASLQVPIRTEEREEQRIDGYTREDFVNNIPWKEFLTHPVSLTLFFNGWTFVSFRCFCFCFLVLTYFLCLSSESFRGLFLLLYYQKCLPFLRII
jgi:MFS family permease